MIRRDKDGLHVNFDVLFLYLVALVMLIVFAIKAIRWAIES
jgi:hypothetical protein